MEIDIDSAPWRDEFYTVVPTIENGEFVLPKGPGWGIDVNEKAVRARAAETLKEKTCGQSSKIATPAGASFTVEGGGYDYEMEALEGWMRKSSRTNRRGWVHKFTQDADAVYAKGSESQKRSLMAYQLSAAPIVLGSVGVDSVDVVRGHVARYPRHELPGYLY